MRKDGWYYVADACEWRSVINGVEIDLAKIGQCLVDEAVAFLWWDGDIVSIRGSYGLRDLAQRAKAAARRLARKGKR
jgi:hypothetical protein